MTTHYEKIQALGNRMASNLESMGVSASFGEGGLTLADKILQIQHFTDGLLLWADKDIIQIGETVTFNALLLDDKKGVSGETIVFYDSNSVPISYDTSGIHTINKNLGKSFMVHYEGDTELQFGDESNTGYSLVYKANKSLEITSSGSSQITWNNVEWVKMVNGVLSDNNGNSFDLSSLVTNVILMHLVGTGSVYFDVVGVGVTDSNGVATVSYTGKGTGVLNIQAYNSVRIISSEIYEVIDAIVIDRATSSDYNNLFSNMNGITRNINDSTYYIDRSGTSASNKSTASYSLGGGLCVEITITEITNIYQLRVSLQGGDGTTVRSIQESDITTGTIRFECKPNNTKIYMNDTLILNENENSITSLVFQVRTLGNSIDNFNYKNLLIYPI